MTDGLVRRAIVAQLTLLMLSATWAYAEPPSPKQPVLVLKATARFTDRGSALIRGADAKAPLALQVTPAWAVSTSEILGRGGSRKYYRSAAALGLVFFKSRAVDIGRSPVEIAEADEQFGVRSERSSWVACANRARPGLTALGVHGTIIHRRGGASVPFLKLAPSADPGLGIGLREDGRVVGVGPVLVRSEGTYCALYGKHVLAHAIESLEVIKENVASALAPEAAALNATADMLAFKDAEAAYDGPIDAFFELSMGHPWRPDLLRDAFRPFLHLAPDKVAACLAAVESFRPLIQKSARMDVLEGELLVKAGRVAEGISLLRSALSDPTSDWESRVSLVKLSFGHHERSAEFLRKVLPLPVAPCPLEDCADLGAGLLRYGKLGAARRLLRRATSAPTAESNTFREYGAVLHKEGEFEEALSALRVALAAPDAPVEWYTDLGDVFLGMDDAKAAERAYSVVVEALGEDALSLRRRAWARLRSGDSDGAIEDLKRATTLAPRDPLGWSLAARIAMACSDRALLDEALMKLDEIDPPSAMRIRKLVKEGGR